MYDNFNLESVPDGCVPSTGDWVTLDPPSCGDGLPCSEKFWDCAANSVISGVLEILLTGTNGVLPSESVVLLDNIILSPCNRWILW